MVLAYEVVYAIYFNYACAVRLDVFAGVRLVVGWPQIVSVDSHDRLGCPLATQEGEKQQR